MAADSRSTHTDALATLGTIINKGEKRDAIHLGVEPVIAGEAFMPGQHVRLIEGKAFGARTEAGIGIVDPFLTAPVQKGQRFWLIVYPRQITSLRHVWEHPSFPDSKETGSQDEPVDLDKIHKVKLLLGEPVAKARQALMDFASDIDVSYDELMEHAADFQKHGDYWSEGGRFEGTSIPANFWENYELVTQTKVNPDKKYGFFSCSC